MGLHSDMGRLCLVGRDLSRLRKAGAGGSALAPVLPSVPPRSGEANAVLGVIDLLKEDVAQ